MASLPTLTVTDSQLAKCVTAFGDAAGYRAWLKEALLDEVQRRESVRLDTAHNTSKRAALEALRAQLPEPDVKPEAAEPPA